jgi:hypothetical protein
VCSISGDFQQLAFALAALAERLELILFSAVYDASEALPCGEDWGFSNPLNVS